MGEIDLLKNQIKELSEKIMFFENSIQKSQKELIKEALKEFTSQQKKNSLKSEFDRKFKKSKKSIIKQKIVEVIKTKPIYLADLKYYIVDQLNYCSKASFYRYIEEMKEELEIKNDLVNLKVLV